MLYVFSVYKYYEQNNSKFILVLQHRKWIILWLLNRKHWTKKTLHNAESGECCEMKHNRWDRRLREEKTHTHKQRKHNSSGSSRLSTRAVTSCSEFHPNWPFPCVPGNGGRGFGGEPANYWQSRRLLRDNWFFAVIGHTNLNKDEPRWASGSPWYVAAANWKRQPAA